MCVWVGSGGLNTEKGGQGGDLGKGLRRGPVEPGRRGASDLSALDQGGKGNKQWDGTG